MFFIDQSSSIVLETKKKIVIKMKPMSQDTSMLRAIPQEL